MKFVNINRHTTAKSIQDNIILPLYRVQISADSIAGKLHEIKHLAHQVIWWEKIKKTETIQCKNCQRLGHMASNCNMKYRYDKCNIAHGPKECQISNNVNETPKDLIYCVLCQSFGHPASYRGCPKQLEFKSKQIMNNNLDKRANSRVTPRDNYTRSDRNRQITSRPHRFTTPRKSFADLMKPSKAQTPAQNNADTQSFNSKVPNEFTTLIETMQQQFTWIIQAVQSNSQKIDKLFALLRPSQPAI